MTRLMFPTRRIYVWRTDFCSKQLISEPSKLGCSKYSTTSHNKIIAIRREKLILRVSGKRKKFIA